MIKVGQKVRFDPHAGITSYGFTMVRGEVTGTVVMVHHKHRYFTAEYEAGGQTFKCSFNFNDLTGDHRNVYIVKE